MVYDARAVLQRRRKIERYLDHLPVLPTLASRLLVLSPDDGAYLDDVHKLAACDPTFAVRIVEYANRVSHYHAEGRPILNLRHALAWLGVKEISGLIMGIAMMEAFPSTDEATHRLWQHSVEVAVIARTLAGLSPDQSLEPEHLYLSGLLHDIGRFLMTQALPNHAALVDEHGWSTPSGLIFAEMDVSAITHAEVGAEACKQWQLPEHIVAVVRHHHNYNLDLANLGDAWVHKKIRLVQIADYFSMWLTRHEDTDEAVNNLSFRTDPGLENLRELLPTLGDVIPLQQVAAMYDHVLNSRHAIENETAAILAGLGIEAEPPSAQRVAFG
jgi:putative nucleotidyltransferase with HDIG domain